MSLHKLKVVRGALDELNENIVLRGVIDPSSFINIEVGSYQREEASKEHIMKLVDALNGGARFPDIEIGIRGNNFREAPNGSGIFYVNHPIFIVDGFQRLTATKRFLEKCPEKTSHLGALMHFGTDEKWERERFRILNTDRSRVSSNVLLRNEVNSLVVQALSSMCKNDAQFVLKDRISWGQRMNRSEILNATTVMKTIGYLFFHFGSAGGNNVGPMVKAMDKTYGTMGANIWRANVREFFSLIDQAFGIKSIAYRAGSPHIRLTFMSTLARILADHKTFWDGNRLTIRPDDVQKLKTFPIFDPGIQSLISSGSKVIPLLYGQLVDHMNKFRRTRKMVKWSGHSADGVLILSETERSDEQD